MGLDSFNEKDNLSRRDILKGTGALSAATLLKIPDASAIPSAEIPAVPLLQPEAISAPELVSEEEVRSIFRKLFGDAECKETRKRDDADGLHLLEVEVPQTDGHMEYSFRRGRPEADKPELPGLRIDMAIYDEKGMPISGHSVAQKIGGVWKLTP